MALDYYSPEICIDCYKESAWMITWLKFSGNWMKSLMYIRKYFYINCFMDLALCIHSTSKRQLTGNFMYTSELLSSSHFSFTQHTTAQLPLRQSSSTKIEGTQIGWPIKLEWASGDRHKGLSWWKEDTVTEGTESEHNPTSMRGNQAASMDTFWNI